MITPVRLKVVDLERLMCPYVGATAIILKSKDLSVNNVHAYRDSTEADDGSGEHREREVRTVRLFVSDQQLAEAVEPRMRDFDDPTPSRIALLVPMLLAARADVRNVAAAADGFGGGRARRERRHLHTGVAGCACADGGTRSRRAPVPTG